jgi:hypothetical protein
MRYIKHCGFKFSEDNLDGEVYDIYTVGEIPAFLVRGARWGSRSLDEMCGEEVKLSWLWRESIFCNLHVFLG